MRINFKKRMLLLQNALCCENIKDIARECGFTGNTPDTSLLHWLSDNKMRLRRKYEIEYVGEQIERK